MMDVRLFQTQIIHQYVTQKKRKKNKRTRSRRKFAYTEVVERGVRQPTSGDIFSQLIKHLGILEDWKKTKNKKTQVMTNCTHCM